MNNCIFIGRLGHDVSIRYTADENAVGRFSMALDNGKDKKPTWINCVAFGKTAENIDRFFKKGNRIAVNTRAQNNDYTDRDGNERKTIDFIVDRFEFVDNKTDRAEKQEETFEGFQQMNDPVPF